MHLLNKKGQDFVWPKAPAFSLQRAFYDRLQMYSCTTTPSLGLKLNHTIKTSKCNARVVLSLNLAPKTTFILNKKWFVTLLQYHKNAQCLLIKFTHKLFQATIQPMPLLPLTVHKTFMAYVCLHCIQYNSKESKIVRSIKFELFSYASNWINSRQKIKFVSK